MSQRCAVGVTTTPDLDQSAAGSPAPSGAVVGPATPEALSHEVDQISEVGQSMAASPLRGRGRFLLGHRHFPGSGEGYRGAGTKLRPRGYHEVRSEARVVVTR